MVAFIFISCGEDNDSDSFDEQLALDVLNIDSYLTENNIEALVHSSGIRYLVDREGTGDAPSVGDDIAVKFELFLFDGDKVGEDTIGFTINLNPPLVEAWQIMIPEMSEGEIMTIYTPSVYAFGSDGSVNVPSNTNVIYRVELLARVDDENEQFEIDQSIIDEYLTENEIEYQVDESGIRFTTLTEGTGDSPLVTSRVTVVYEGTYLNGTVFDTNESGISFVLSNLIEAWQIMIPTLQEGGSIKIYCPSRYCYGPSGSNTIPPNTILVFEIELVSFE